MDNRTIADLFEETADLLELHQENEFKSKALRSAAFAISKYPDPITGMNISELSSMKGIGKSIAAKIVEIATTGNLQERTDLLSITPKGLLELFEVKGLGPKKISMLWKGLSVESPGELLYACNENRLLTLKGFSEKSQSEIKKSLEFKAAHQGLFHYAAAEKTLQLFLSTLSSIPFQFPIEVVGEMRRKCEVIKNIHLATSATSIDFVEHEPSITSNHFTFKSTEDSKLVLASIDGPGIEISLNVPSSGWHLMKMIGPDDHVQEISGRIPNLDDKLDLLWSESEIYSNAGLTYVLPELRDLPVQRIIDLQSQSKSFVEYGELKGCLHNHSTYSDGASSLKDMALAAQQEGLQYFAICDHSKSAFYAGGLKEEDIIRQHLEIDRLNKELSPFRIFKGIESDILPDGSLDYADDVLASFEIVVASIHSGLNMDLEKATNRLIKAIENPFTTILGHPTGRLLLSRQGYPIDHLKVLDACAANGVAVELNAHPYRLDMDWRWLHHAVERGVMVSINPDAHHVSGITDMQYGVHVARKAGLFKSDVLNGLDLEAFIQWLQTKKTGIV